MKPINKIFRLEIQFVSKGHLPKGTGGGDTDVRAYPKSGQEPMREFLIKIAHHQKESRMQDFLAHELGHVMADIFWTDAAKNDPRIGSSASKPGKDIRKCRSTTERRAIKRNEEEAWAFGRKIRPQINSNRIRLAVESYL